MILKYFSSVVCIIFFIACSHKPNLEKSKLTQGLVAPQKTILHSAYKMGDRIEVRQYILTNGLTVVLTKNRRAPEISINHWVNVGSIHELKNQTGLAHLFEHMMFRPVRNGESNFFDKLKQLQGSANANTRYESTFYDTSVPTANLGAALKLEADRFQNLVVTAELLKTEKQAVLSEYVTKMDSEPGVDLWTSFYRIGYPGHPFSWTIVGERADLQKITAEQCNEFFKAYYRPQNVGIFIAGNFEFDKTVQLVEQYYSGWSPSTKIPIAPQFPMNSGSIDGTSNLPASVSQGIIGFRMPQAKNENAKLNSLLLSVLSNSNYSLSDRKLKYEESLVSSITPHNSVYDTGSIKWKIVLNPSFDWPRIKKVLLNFPNDIANMPDSEFQSYLRNHRVSIVEDMTRNRDLNDLLTIYWGRYKNLHMIYEVFEKPLNITKKELVDFARTIITPENMILVKSPLLGQSTQPVAPAHSSGGGSRAN